jgi:hypothetical protein
MFFSVDIQYECTLNHNNIGVSLFSFSNEALQVVPRVILVCAALIQLGTSNHTTKLSQNVLSGNVSGTK